MEQHHSSRLSDKASPAHVARRGASYPAPVRSSRSPLREERHPNAVTAPPVNRGSMPVRPWRGFWNGIGTALLQLATGRLRSTVPAIPREGWETAAARRRLVFAVLTLLSTLTASVLFANAQPDYDNVWLQYGQIALFAVLST
ncbi:MAG: glucans biosynthesis glucosyltransferase MdoH, partial [Burkholderiaceae bacterium]